MIEIVAFYKTAYNETTINGKKQIKNFLRE